MPHNIALSFEFFPPKTEAMERTLWESIERLAPLQPRFVSVTYGADGSTRDRTHRIVHRIIEQTRLVCAPHLTCIGAPRDAVLGIARGYHAAGIRHIVALRGDLPSGQPYDPTNHDYRYAAELVAGLREVGAFDISVAAYPEVHPEAPSAEFDLDNLKRKAQAGAARAITQFFFDNECFLRFRDRCEAGGLAIPLVPGILPISNFKRMVEFAGKCGASVPASLQRLFAERDGDAEGLLALATEVAVKQIDELVAHGVHEFHFYTLNRAELTLAICRALGEPARRPLIASQAPA
jgi:methylenetetrahydrofolate reductase (NADPH)